MDDPLLELQRSPKLFYNATEAAPIFDRDPRTVRKACETGQIPAIRVGRLWLISRETLLHLLGAQAA